MLGLAKPDRILGQCFEDRLQVEGGATDHLEERTGGGLLLARLGQLAPQCFHRLILADCRHFGRHEDVQPFGSPAKIAVTAATLRLKTILRYDYRTHHAGLDTDVRFPASRSAGPPAIDFS